jgi:hypothetical protein
MEIRYIPALELAGWSEDDIANCNHFFATNRFSPPQVAPSVDLDRKFSFSSIALDVRRLMVLLLPLLEWSEYLRKVNGSTWRPDSNRRLRDSLEPFYNCLGLTQSPLHSDLFPTLTEFEKFKALKVYWQDPNSKPLTKSHWLSLLPSILIDLDQYYQALRVEAIRAILSAQQGVSVTKISSSPSDYPESLYPDSFFDLATSRFPSHWSSCSFEMQPYPQVGIDGMYAWTGRGTFSRLAERRTTLTIQAMIEAAGLDQATATAVELESLGRRFTWDNDT